MAFSNPSEGEEVLSEINITPLVDVMLVLLVAFIVTAPLLNNAITVNLPKTAATQPPENRKPVTISITDAGKVYLDKQEIAQDKLEGELLARQKSYPDQVYHLSSDEKVQYGSVAKVMASIERAGITKLAVLTQSQ